ncbi:hypothetical protein EYF80_067082 [Liparis tanakae]|uniref:Uncharacterized protein n=1 Tax=Liparis tanakae TaxID=230148 RepID=A0A4Z2E237_9TELE|nr:hypothetical protein EYF80_067082 [Liparis tanakae]
MLLLTMSLRKRRGELLGDSLGDAALFLPPAAAAAAAPPPGIRGGSSSSSTKNCSADLPPPLQTSHPFSRQKRHSPNKHKELGAAAQPAQATPPPGRDWLAVVTPGRLARQPGEGCVVMLLMML